jgi:hypothetical protein
MIERPSRVYFLTVAAAASALLLVFLIVRPREEVRPREAEGLAQWLRRHPSDFAAATALLEVALDSRIPSRFELWRDTYRLATRLAPYRPHPRQAFVRSGLFHWYELTDGDRRAVLAAAAPLLRDPEVFAAMRVPLWELTENFDYLLRNHPPDVESLVVLRDLAAENGLFDRYRTLRGEVVRQRLADFETRKAAMSPAAMLALVPLPVTRDDERFVHALLQELHNRPLDAEPVQRERLNALLEYALDHDLGPLDGLESILLAPETADDPLRARLAVRLGALDRASAIEVGSSAREPLAWEAYFAERAEAERASGELPTAKLYGARMLSLRRLPHPWRGLCGTEICATAAKTVLAERGGPQKLTLAPVAGDSSVPPYVEIFVDGSRVAEAPLPHETMLDAGTLSEGVHRLEIALVNPLTRERRTRRVRLVHEAL